MKYHWGYGYQCEWIHCFSLCVSSQLAVPHSEDWARFARTLMEIKANRADGEEEGPVELTP